MTENYKNVIYILTNPALDGFVKIGFASDLRQRIKQLSQASAIPYSFQAYAVYETPAKLTDKALHDMIDSLNPTLRTVEQDDQGKTHKKEFFIMSPEEAFTILEDIAKISGTTERLHRIKPTKEETEETAEATEVKKTAMLKPFTFSACDIPIGAEVVFTRDPSIIGIVVDDKHIKIGNEISSLSAVVMKYTGWKSAQGPAYFTYNGKLLKEIHAEKCGKK
ncbi:GIY-YIG nuclease family protein [Galactobacillus timonensis]|uniref:GIY-YIG nuclease family protein n=1 Tax=Galactobacillus timonensis TaxID=2041840 RepID=UPI000C84A777|nr:GIY-YIG nuclease family protein [Galactobacillus timonensis]